MAQISTNDFKAGIKIEVDGQPYTIVSNQFVKPGKGQAFNRVRIKHLLTDRTIERNIKSGESFELADVKESKMRLLYVSGDGAVFMDDESFEQLTIPESKTSEIKQWLLEDQIYSLVFYKGEIATVEPPTFMELTVTETNPGNRGDTASGRVLKAAVVNTGAKVQVPIFIEEGEVIKVDTRTGEYVARVNK